MRSNRMFSSTGAVMREISAPFKSVVPGKGVSVDRNIPYFSRPKAWEKDGRSREEWFRKKYAHVHAKDKSKQEKKDIGSDENEGFVKNRRFQRDPVSRLQPSPLHDYVYGVGPVIAALKAQKRDAFTELLYHNPKDRHDEIMDLAEKLDVPVKSSSKMILNQLTNNNVHNGYVLKTRHLLPVEITRLAPLDPETQSYGVVSNEFGQENVEELMIARQNADKRYPLGVYLDEISDPHNVGLILRTAYYLGVDFVVMSEKNCSKLTPLVSKASSGAMEFMNIFSVNKPVDFIEKSQQNGWVFISSSVAPSRKNRNLLDLDHLSLLLLETPCILVFGSEGSGIRTNILTRSDYTVSLQANRVDLDDSVDSLNVSVAAGLLLQKFL